MADLKNIALVVEAVQVLDRIEKEYPVTHRMDIARLGFAYAVREGVSPNSDLGKGSREGGANYGSAGFDPGGKMADMVAVFFADDPLVSEPNRVIENLANAGLILLGRHLDEGKIGSISDLVPNASRVKHLQ
ncbi:hypothetical protein ACBR38_21305 [Streptomyces sp. MAD19A]|uniref:hypothetical protein n=1 Tax=Streptomyces sp. MAD19A TaxID=3242896 RepID=UPI003528A413